MASSPGLGLFLALFSAASYGLMSFLVHWNAKGFPVEQMIFWRGVISVVGVLPFCYKDVHRYFLRDSKSLWIRSFSGALGATCYFYALQGTSSANANFLFSSSPLFVTIFSRILFQEKLSRREGFGVLLILLANILLYIPNQSTMPLWVWVTGVSGALFASIAFLSIGAATKKYSSSLIVLGFSVMSTLFSLALPGKSWLTPTLEDSFYLFAVGLLGLLSQFTMTLSFVHLKSSVATALGRTSILFSGVLDITLARYAPHPLEWISYIVVILGVNLSRASSRKSLKPLN